MPHTASKAGPGLGRARPWLLASLCLAWLCLIALPARAAGPDLAQLLAYDASAPLQLRVLKREHRAGVLIEDVTYDSVAGAAPVTATLVRPTHLNAPFAGIVWGHWFEPAAANSNRSQFVREAASLARLGVVSVLPDTLWANLQWFDTRSWRNDFAHTLNQAKDFRRALDVLLAQNGVDPHRIGFVGHDFSAMHGALIAAVETRVKAYVLIAGTARWADWYLFGAADGVPQGGELAAYLAQLAQIDPVLTMVDNKAGVMFQFGEDDFFTPRANFTGFYAASAIKTSRIATYASRHPMDAPIIRVDRQVWLGEQLGLPLRHRDSEESED